MSRTITVTAKWLDSRNDDGYPRAWIKGKYFYITNKSPDSDIEYKTGHLAPQKYRFLGQCVDKYAFRIVTLKTDGFGC